LQNLLGGDPRVVSPQETSLFSRYVAPLDDSWNWQLRGTADDWAARRFIGLGSVVTEEEFTSLVQRFVQQVLCRTLALKPGATVVLEKTPSHSLHVDAIARYAPDVRFLHIVRDGRDVVSSLVEASDGWGRAWGAPATVRDAAQIWRDYVEGARRAQDLGPYREVRYEDLRGDGAAALLAETFAFCGVPIDADEASTRLEHFAFVRQRADGVSSLVFGGEAAAFAPSGSEPAGFFGSGPDGGRRPWPVSDRVEFDAIAGTLLRELGYVADDSWIAESRTIERARRVRGVRTHAARVLGAAGRRLQRLGERVGRGAGRA
jgi:hypothetical protein